MERTGPRIYVPLSIPDHASQPTYAVLEFVGFSSPAPSSSSPHLLHPSPALPSPSPAMLCLPPASSSSSSSPSPSFFPLSVPPPLHPLISSPHNSLISPPSHFPISHFPDHNSLYLPSPPHLIAHHPRPLPTSRLDIVNLESPPSSPSSLAPSSASSVSRDSSKDKHPHSSTSLLSHPANPMTTSSVVSPAGLTKPLVTFSSSPSDAASSLACGSSRPIVTFNSSADGTPCGLNKSMVNFSSADCSASGLSKHFNSSCEGEIMQTQISVSQTDRETIVHTHSSNFRDVVRQLTGASSDDQDLLPVTLPARLANRVNNANTVQNVNISTEIVVSGAGVGAGSGASVSASTGTSKDQLGLRKAPLKLHERRKSTMKNLEKITTAYNHHAATELSPLNPSPVTPLASDFERFCNASTPTSQGNSGLSSPINLISKGKSSMEGSNERRGGEHQQESSGCFYMQRPTASGRLPPAPLEKASPTLLSLFPESPACSPRDR